MSHSAENRVTPGSQKRSLSEGLMAVVNLYRTRFELLLLDLEEEKERLEQRLILTAITAFLFGLGSLVVTAFFVALLWPNLGAGALALFAVLYLGGAGSVLFTLRRQNRDRHRTFVCTLREFEKDAERFARALQENQESSPTACFKEGIHQ